MHGDAGIYGNLTPAAAKAWIVFDKLRSGEAAIS